VNSRNERRGSVPKLHHALTVYEEDPVADCLEDTGGLLALGSDG
jgi:hypothetical protein